MSVPKPVDEAAAINGGNDRQPSSKSLDFRGKREISHGDWADIELELHDLSARATAVEVLGRGVCDAVNGERLESVFTVVSADIHRTIDRLKELLGLASEEE